MQIEALSLTADPYMREIARKVTEHTKPEDKLVVINGGFWGGDLLILSGRTGVSADTPDTVHMNEQGRSLPSLGYNKILFAIESPLLHASQVFNPGAAQRKLITRPAFQSQSFHDFDAVYEDEVIMNKRIPVFQ